MARKLKPTGKTPRNLYRTSKSQERAGAGPGHLPSIVVGSGPARREGLVSLPNAVPLTVVSGGSREPLGRMQGPAGRSQTGMQGSSKDKGSVPPQTLEASRIP